MFARAYDQRLLPQTVPQATSRSGRTNSRLVASVGGSSGSGAPASSAALVASKLTPTLKLSLAEIADRRTKGQCFHCNDQFTNGHRQICKQLFIIEVLFEEKEQSLEDPTISLHALTGIQSSTARTMQLKVMVNGATLTALLDSGSTHNFLDADIMARIGITFHDRLVLPVAVANDDCLVSSGCCCGFPAQVGCEIFSVNCYGLQLGSFDIVLGIQWLESLGPILWDFRKSLNHWDQYYGTSGNVLWRLCVAATRFCGQLLNQISCTRLWSPSRISWKSYSRLSKICSPSQWVCPRQDNAPIAFVC
jgi:hypothetical protein